MKIKIKSIWGSLLFEYDCEDNSIKKTLQKAIEISANLRGANLSGANLRGANLRGVDLSGANLRGANLRGVDLSDVDLSGVDLSDVDLSGADLSGANLRGANLRGVDLSGANLRGVDLSDVDLRGANLRGANLRGANLSGANLRGVDLSDVDLSEGTCMLLSQCPTEGSFIAWKKASGFIVKLQITEDSKRSSATSLKCRCSKAIVLGIENCDGSKSDRKIVESNYTSSFKYEVGKTVEEPNFDGNRWNECSSGIHFFISRDMAVKYN